MKVTHSLLLLTMSFFLSCKHGQEEEALNSGAKIQDATLAANKELPSNLVEIGLFKDGTTTEPADGVISYDVKVPLWSDDAHKQRFVFVPSDKKITQDANGKFTFPAGTVFAKYFAASADGSVPIETRIIALKEDGKWAYATYVWDDSGAAVKNTRPRKVSKKDIEFRIPSEQECKNCHSEGRPILGFTPAQLNTSVNDTPQMAQLEKKNIFAGAPTALLATATLDHPKDEALPIEKRMRAYLEVNCSPCHHPGGPEKANKLDFRLEAEDTFLISEKKVVPGKPDESLLWKRYSATSDRMPPLSLRVDPLGLDLIKKYIEQWPSN